MSNFPLVDKFDDGIRPAGPPDECFYCRRKVGEEHAEDCVTVRKLVRVRYTIELNIEMPYNWGKDDIEFNRNNSTWCANNALQDIKEYIDKQEAKCLCDGFNCEFIKVVDDTPRRDLKPTAYN